MLPRRLRVPFTLSIYPKIEYKNVVLPEPTLPMTLTNCPLGISIFGIYKFSTTAVLEEEDPAELLSLS